MGVQMGSGLCQISPSLEPDGKAEERRGSRPIFVFFLWSLGKKKEGSFYMRRVQVTAFGQMGWCGVWQQPGVGGGGDDGGGCKVVEGGVDGANCERKCIAVKPLLWD